MKDVDVSNVFYRNNYLQSENFQLLFSCKTSFTAIPLINSERGAQVREKTQFIVDLIVIGDGTGRS